MHDLPAKQRKCVRANRPTERACVRAVTAIFEDANMLVQPIDGSLDIGKDLYVDLTEDNEATGELIALQVKAGKTYRAGSSYVVPCRPADVSLWKSSTVPIFGIDEEQMRSLIGLQVGRPRTIARAATNMALYRLVFGSRNQKGIDIWNDICRRTRHEQYEMFLGDV